MIVKLPNVHNDFGTNFEVESSSRTSQAVCSELVFVMKFTAVTTRIICLAWAETPLRLGNDDQMNTVTRDIQHFQL